MALACDSGAYPWIRLGPLGDSAFSSICCGCQHPKHKAELRSSKEWKAGEKPVVVI